MTRLRIALSLTLVGPRAHLLGQSHWPAALRIAIGADGDDSTPGQRRALVEACLPWRVFAADTLPLRVHSATGSSDVDGIRPDVAGVEFGGVFEDGERRRHGGQGKIRGS